MTRMKIDGLRVGTIPDDGITGPFFYQYQVTRDVTTNYMAFKSLAGLVHWCRERGLMLPEQDEEGALRGPIQGSFLEEVHNDLEAFWRVQGRYTLRTSNGDLTLAILTTDPESGLVVVHYCNPNVRRRPVFDHHRFANLDF